MDFESTEGNASDTDSSDTESVTSTTSTEFRLLESFKAKCDELIQVANDLETASARASGDIFESVPTTSEGDVDTAKLKSTLQAMVPVFGKRGALQFNFTSLHRDYYTLSLDKEEIRVPANAKWTETGRAQKNAMVAASKLHQWSRNTLVHSLPDGDLPFYFLTDLKEQRGIRNSSFSRYDKLLEQLEGFSQEADAIIRAAKEEAEARASEDRSQAAKDEAQAAEEEVETLQTRFSKKLDDLTRRMREAIEGTDISDFRRSIKIKDLSAPIGAEVDSKWKTVDRQYRKIVKTVEDASGRDSNLDDLLGSLEMLSLSNTRASQS